MVEGGKMELINELGLMCEKYGFEWDGDVETLKLSIKRMNSMLDCAGIEAEKKYLVAWGEENFKNEPEIRESFVKRVEAL